MKVIVLAVARIRSRYTCKKGLLRLSKVMAEKVYAGQHSDSYTRKLCLSRLRMLGLMYVARIDENRRLQGSNAVFFLFLEIITFR